VSGVVPLTREVVALASRYIVVVVGGGMVEIGPTLTALSGSSQSGGREEFIRQQLRDILSLNSKITNRNMSTAEDTRTKVMLSRLRGGPEGREGEWGNA